MLRAMGGTRGPAGMVRGCAVAVGGRRAVAWSPRAPLPQRQGTHARSVLYIYCIPCIQCIECGGSRWSDVQCGSVELNRRDV